VVVQCIENHLEKITCKKIQISAKAYHSGKKYVPGQSSMALLSMTLRFIETTQQTSNKRQIKHLHANIGDAAIRGGWSNSALKIIWKKLHVRKYQ
jgi:hypothetical protein